MPARPTIGSLEMRRGIMAALVIWVFCGGTATAEDRVALVIGNGAYAEAPLKNPPNDARLIAETLRRLDFDVIEAIDATQNQMKQAIVDRFVEDFAGFDIVAITSDEIESPAAREFSTILFGSFHDTVFGVSLGLDAYNVDQCDDGIIFADSFKPPGERLSSSCVTAK